MLAIGGLIKFLPLLALVPLCCTARRPQAKRLLFAAVVVFGGAYGVLLCGGYQPIGSLFMVAQTWAYGSSSFEWMADYFGDTAARGLAASMAISGLVVGGWFGWRGKWMLGILVAFTTTLAASPMFFPWYLASMVPAIAVAPASPLVVWFLSQPLAYADLGQDGDSWRGVSWMSLAALLWVADAVHRELRPRRVTRRGSAAPARLIRQ